ncbi:hypothetical protein FJZ26_04970, partial [Candidatus Parvarchaeota archaeon]|nr:hypothetical protein [Candidatus Parvarchaeota archaeon]
MANTIPRTRCPLSSALSSPATLHALIAVVLLISVVFSATNNVILNSPQEGFITNSSSVEFNYTVTTFKPSDKVKCNLMVDEKSKKSETFQYATAYQASETVKLTDAQHKV